MHPQDRISHSWRRLACVCAAFVTLMATDAMAGAWAKPAGGGYLKLGSATFVSQEVYDDEGTRLTSDPFTLRAQTIYAYGEVGITDRLTLVGFAPWIVSTNQHKSGVNFHTLGFGDAMGGIQVGLFQGGPMVLSTRFELKVPLYEGGPSIQGRQTQAVEGFPRSTTFFPALGDGQIDATAWLSGGATLPLVDGFTGFEAGYRRRTNGVTDALVFVGNAGVYFLPGVVLGMANVQHIYTFPVTDAANEILGKGYWSAGLAMSVVAWRGLAIEVGADYVFLGRNAAGGVQVLFGVSYSF